MRRSRVWMPRDIYYYFGALNRASVCYHWREIVIFAVVCFRRPICSECCLLPPMPCLAGVRKIDREKCKCAVETEFFAENSLPTQVRQHFLHMRHDNNKMMAFYPNDRPFRRGTHWVCVSCRAATSPANCVMNCDDASFFALYLNWFTYLRNWCFDWRIMRTCAHVVAHNKSRIWCDSDCLNSDDDDKYI